MRHFLTLPVLLMLFALPAGAQVTVDLNALDQLKKPAPSNGPSVRKPVPSKPKAAKPQAEKPAPPKPTPSEAAPAPAKAPPGFHAPLPALPGGPPPNVELAPVPPPVAPANKPSSSQAPPAVAPTAAGTGRATPGGLRVTFGAGQGEMSPASEQALKTLAARTAKNDAVSYNVLAYAAGSPEDPSTARRLSLARALAVRSVLMSAGVPSTRIYVRALGAGPGPGGHPVDAKLPPDRVDVSVLGANAPPPELALPQGMETVGPEAPAAPRRSRKTLHRHREP